MNFNKFTVRLHYLRIFLQNKIDCEKILSQNKYYEQTKLIQKKIDIRKKKKLQNISASKHKKIAALKRRNNRHKANK